MKPPEPAAGPVARALEGLVFGRLTWWMGWPFVLLGAAGLEIVADAESYDRRSHRTD